ncbi:MAG: hypothetical protein IKE66_14500 [Hyphomicrobium sp.]|nr:hypothetical protein [Hyphomicrobium sp.]
MQKSVLTLALVAVAGLATAGIAATSTSAASDGVRCEIAVKERSGRVTLEGFVDAASSISGSYELLVSKAGGGGSAHISQGGEFSAAAGARTPLGNVVLGGDAGSYSATLKVTWDGKSVSCKSGRGSL